MKCLFACVFFSAWLMSPSRALSQKDKLKQILRGVYLVEAKEEEKIWELWSNEVQGFQHQKNWSLKGVKIHFFSKNGLQFILKGKKGLIENFDTQKNILIEGQVEGVSSSGYRFQGEKIKYFSKNQFLKSLGPIKVNGAFESPSHSFKPKNFHIQAQDMEISLQTSSIHLKKNVISSYYFSSPLFFNEQTLQIQSQSLTLNHQPPRAHFSGNVFLWIGDKKLKTSQASVKYDLKNDQINSIQLSGGVEMKEKVKTLQAERLDLDIKKDQMTFHGPSQIIYDKNKFTGHTITVTANGTHVRIKEAQLKIWIKLDKE